ncbi:MAG TPA: hypothetical protein VKO41_08465 [Gaiellaceae bacterium]|nr:hypothetical protein [Gaiellaceae bacterium]
MRVADQFRDLESRLPADWADAQLVLTVDDDRRYQRAAELLAPLGPGRRGGQVRFVASRREGRVDLLRRLLARIDRERIRGKLEVVTYSQAVPEPAAESRASWPPLEEAWLSAVAALPDDWSDLYAEVELASSDFLEPGALRLAPLNPSRPDRDLAIRFRVARSFGYGASPDMARRCFERLDEAEIRGRLKVLWALSDTKAVATQGPVWYGRGGPV